MTWGHLDTPGPSPHFKAPNSIISAKSFSPGQVTRSQVLGIRMWASLGSHCVADHDGPALLGGTRPPPSNLALCFPPDTGGDEVPFLVELPVHSRGETDINRHSIGTFYQDGLLGRLVPAPRTWAPSVPESRSSV